MEVRCHQCESRLTIADEKIPAGRISTVRCPKCRAKISIDLRPKEPGQDEEAGFSANGSKGFGDDFDQVRTEAYDASEKPFDFLEEEGKTALVCEDDPQRLQTMKKTLELMEYHITEPSGIRDALRKMKYHVYDLILVNERFDNSEPDSNGVLIYLERMAMDVRREIYVALITEHCATMDYMSAFLKSVNMVIHPKDLGSLDRLLTRGINERDMFYNVFRESAKKHGKL
ncbi:MAG TPA: zinc-ribbon domain-containing protein [Desulfosalsimonadaceae bacterium]|nr:zinc-ribbon domain-containing protein [Desulfosalsimonadaceae bacterium]